MPSALACCPATTLSAGPPDDCSAAAIPDQTAQGKIGTTNVPHGGSHEGKTFRMLPTKGTPRQTDGGPRRAGVQGWDIEYDPQNIRASFVGAIGSLRVEYGTRKGDMLSE